MAHLHKRIRINASADDVWAVLGDLAATPEWLPGTTTARIEGPIRVCTTHEGAEIREEISGYSPESRSYTYRHLEMPLPIRHSRGTFTVQPVEAGSVVALEAEFEALDPAMETELERMFGGALDQALASLRRRVEDGLTWQAA
jgi:uncharacterized protein YndB with AHSA1/START domain